MEIPPIMMTAIIKTAATAALIPKMAQAFLFFILWLWTNGT